jgi:hypothetical protein
VVLDTPALEDKKVADNDVKRHGTELQDIQKTAAGSSVENPDPGKAVRILEPLTELPALK